VSKTTSASDAADAPRTAVVLEADAMVRQLLVDQLTLLGLRAIAAIDTGAAREALRLANPSIDLLVTGLKLVRSTDGAAFAAEVRQTHPATAVIVVAGYVDARTAATLRMEDIQLLTKPFRLKDIERLISKALASRDTSGS
jgi:DNA-binding NtrC family response regulator